MKTDVNGNLHSSMKGGSPCATLRECKPSELGVGCSPGSTLGGFMLDKGNASLSQLIALSTKISPGRTGINSAARAV